MIVTPGPTAFRQLIANRKIGADKIPPKTDPLQYKNGGLFPAVSPRFKLMAGEKIFTIGSCFARNIENNLKSSGFDVPVMDFRLPEGEFPHSATHLLNEYNPGTILQRVKSVVGDFQYRNDMGLEETSIGIIDLFLHINTQPASIERVLERRDEIRNLYANLLTSDTVILTLGLIECWFDKKNECYLNKAPSFQLAARFPDRYELRRLDCSDVLPMLKETVETLLRIAGLKILLTVSPVPLEATFTPNHCVIANGYSKAVLRSCIEPLLDLSERVDYFPSYEMVLSNGSGAMGEDNVHPTGEIIAAVTRHMTEAYA